MHSQNASFLISVGRIFEAPGFQFVKEDTMSSSSSESETFSAKKLFFVPKEWEGYPSQTLDCVMYSSLKDYYRRYETIKGASVTMNGVPATAVPFMDYFWMRKEVDSSGRPSPAEYSVALIDNYQCKH